MHKSDLLIRTKLRPPHTRPTLVPRPRLQSQIAQGLRGPLTLIAAPAGFGKTTLVTSCIPQAGMQAAWLSLDKHDNQEGRFLRYLIAALQEIDQAVGNEAAQLLSAAQQIPSETILTSLINDLDISEKEIVLVLDDYQFISTQAVHEALAFLLEHCPQTFHLLIATRSDPLLPLARLRARGQTVELRADDLRFDEDETSQFLIDIMELHLDRASVATLAERTEGWIVGLQMAALSMRDRQDINGFIESFSGTNRYILDYLLEEVLAVQPPQIQRFLLSTSILERLSASLCAAVLEAEGVEDWNIDKSSLNLQPSSYLNCQSILEYLERANLFLVPLDDERQWYRYHHLFADLLQTQFKKSAGDHGVVQSHLCASKWYEQHGSILDAIHHASLASDDERVERLIEQNYVHMSNQGEMFGVRFWLGKLSKDLVYQRPWLCLYEALNRCWFGQLEEAILLLAKAEDRIRADLSASDAPVMLAYHDYIKSRATAMQGDTLRAIQLCRIARDNIPADNLGLQIDVNITLGYEYFLYGDFVNARQALQEEILLGAPFRAVNNTVAAYCLLARMSVYQSRLHAAFNLLQKARQMIQEAGSQSLGVTGLVELGFAALSYEWNDLEAALAHATQALKLLPFWGKVDDTILTHLILARIHMARANINEAIDAVKKATHLVQTSGVFSEARHAITSTRVKIWLAQGDLQSASRWAASQEETLESGDPFGFEKESILITLARVWMAQKQVDDAIDFLSRLEGRAKSAGRMGRVIEIMLLKALAYQETGDSQAVRLELTESLRLAEPEGYVRIFLDEGHPVQALLAQWLAHSNTSPLQDYARRLLSQFAVEPTMFQPSQGKAPPPQSPLAIHGQTLFEPLSQRELEVLQHIALGKTNQEIALQLIVSPGTVKAHTSSIYRKLDVANRTEAVARARQLDLLS
jgi:LuxR family transcriptional regulator, maltose regulon positive regulatory protein